MEILAKEKILFIQTAFIGDAILVLPAIQEYKKKFAEAEINVVCIPSTAEIFAASPSVTNIIVLDKKGKHKSWKNFFMFCIKLRKTGYKKIFSFHRSFRTSLMVLESKVQETYGFSNASLKYAYKHLVNYNHKDHEVKRNLLLAGFDYDNETWKILPEVKTDSVKTNLFLSENNIKKEFIAVAPGSIWNTKKYPLEYFKEVIESLSEKDKNIVLFGSRQDEELCNSLLINEKVYSSAGKFSIIESIELLRNASLLITNDSAPAHFGLAANIPVVMLYCSTVPDFGFYPYNNNSSWMSFEKLECKPCGIHGYRKCPLEHFKCGFELKPDLVINYITEKYS